MYLTELMTASKVKFGTSGARGLATDMTDRVCYAYTQAFVQYLEKTQDLGPEAGIALAGDLRESTDRILAAVAKAVVDRGYGVEYWGRIPTPAVAYYGLQRGMPTIMVTGSHIPEDRNGIKFTKKDGEILKRDEAGIKEQLIELDEGLFDDQGMLARDSFLPSPHREAAEEYVQRYTRFFPSGCLSGLRIGLYEHSAVGRDLTRDILERLGAFVTLLARSETFIPVDTEAIRPEDRQLAAKWAQEYGFDAIVSTDGDGDRPLISDENGEWLRGDVAGILCARDLEADAVVVPVSCNTALEKTGAFEAVYRTRIGSPYVIEGMQQAAADGYARVVGYEANGGFLTGTPVRRNGRSLSELPTRDALIVVISVLHQVNERQTPVSALVRQLPKRYTYSDRLTSFPPERSRELLEYFSTGDAGKDRQRMVRAFGDLIQEVHAVDRTDGLRITAQSGDILHIRPSGNAPELRCYTEADSPAGAGRIHQQVMKILDSWR
ncbi:phosphomannomutase [Desulfovermiculus halophilus]|uniref:phosphomannomutase n=1 Tax=Desulfovermiculus halophilus TaxID=339722 RepID=UPI000484ED6D|nr:phosphomannomutase [Desulfovermiculus halophilus]